MLYLKPIPNAKLSDFKALSKIDRVRLRISERKSGFKCWLSIYQSDAQKHGKSIPLEISDMSYMGNLYAKVCHHIKLELEAEDLRMSYLDDDGIYIMQDDTPVDELVEAYRQAMLFDFGDNITGNPTKRGRIRSQKAEKWRNLGDFIHSFNDEDEAKAAIISWLLDWQAKPKKNGQSKKGNTMNKAVSETRSFLGWLYTTKLVSFHIEITKYDIIWRKFNSDFAPYYMIDEVRAMFAVDDKHVDRIKIHADSGLRFQEVLNLRWSHIKRNNFLIRRTKTDDPRYVQIMPELMEVLEKRKAAGHIYEGFDKYTGEFEGHDFIFSQLDRKKHYCSHVKDIERIQKKAGISPIEPEALEAYEAALKHAPNPDLVEKPRHRRFHAFRWTYAGCMLRSGFDSSRLILQLGHKDPKMMRHYAQIEGLMHEVDDENWPNGQLMFSDKVHSRLALQLVGS